MSHPAYSVQKLTLVTKAITLMAKFGFRHFPVMDGPEKLVGILSDRELLGAAQSSACEDVMVQKLSSPLTIFMKKPKLIFKAFHRNFHQ